MSIKFVAPLLLAGIFAFACGPRSHSSEPTRSTGAHAVSGRPIASSLDVRIADGGEVTFTLHVTNTGSKRLELNFPSGQTHELVVLDEREREIWRWSAGRMFTQSVQNRVVDASDTITYEERWSPPAMHGTYTAVATLLSTNHPVEQRLQFTLP